MTEAAGLGVADEGRVVHGRRRGRRRGVVVAVVDDAALRDRGEQQEGEGLVGGSWQRLLVTSTLTRAAGGYSSDRMSVPRLRIPNDTAAVKLLWLAICNIEDKRAHEREKERRNRKPGEARRSVAGKLIQGATTTNWKQALAQLSLAYPERINPHL